jgi:hypothetical protein
MNDPTPPLPGLSPVAGKAIMAQFDGGLLSSDSGVLALRTPAYRRSVRRLHRRSAGARSDHPHPGRHHSLSPADDCGWL